MSLRNLRPVRWACRKLHDLCVRWQWDRAEAALLDWMYPESKAKRY